MTIIRPHLLKRAVWARSIPVIVAIGLAACSVSSPLTVQSTATETAAPRTQIALSLPDDETGTMRQRFANALIEAFATRGVTIDDGARLVADIAVSEGSAEMGVQHSPVTAQPEGADPDWIDPPREPRRFDRCEALEMRGTLMLVDRATGTIAYRGTGAATECDFGDAALRAMAEGLVADFFAS